MDPIPPRSSKNVVSVNVSTYNRAAKLQNCIDSLLAMNVPDGVSWELICVDNNSNDGTRRFIEESARRSLVPIKYIFEGVQGISPARNAGLRASTGDIIAITDDDCIVDPNWLACIWNAFRDDPSLDMAGGRVELYNPADLPMTIRPSREKQVVVTWSPFDHILGANMAFRRRVIEAIGLFDLRFGAGTKTASAEDSDFIYRAFKAGFRIVYLPDILVRHDHGRREESARDKLAKGYVTGRGAFYMKHILLGDRQALKLAYWEVRYLLGSVLKQVRRQAGHADDARVLGHLAAGFWYYLLSYLRGPV